MLYWPALVWADWVPEGDAISIPEHPISASVSANSTTDTVLLRYRRRDLSPPIITTPKMPNVPGARLIAANHRFKEGVWLCATVPSEVLMVSCELEAALPLTFPFDHAQLACAGRFTHDRAIMPLKLLLGARLTVITAEPPRATLTAPGVALTAKSGAPTTTPGGGGGGGGGGAVVALKNSPMPGADAAAPGKDDIPSACSISFSVLWCWYVVLDL